jgi:PilZ domain
MTITIERRRSRRTTPGAAVGDVLVMDANQRWMMPAKLLDISSHGGLIRPRELVATGRRICLLFENLPEAGWIEAEVVRSGGPREVGIRFLAPLSDEFVRGTTGGGGARRSDPEGKTPYLGDVIPTW